MNYLIYFKDTGKISHTSSSIEDDEQLSSIEISFELMTEFLSGAKSLSRYIVVGDSLGNNKELFDKHEFNKKISEVDNRIYRIPKNKNANIKIIQKIKDKSCSLEISDIDREKLKKGSFENLFFTACLNDPYLPLWIWVISAEDILNNKVTYNYQGTDSFIFYTKKIFDNYSHDII